MIKLHERIELKRGVDVTQIPYGGKTSLPLGSKVTVTQALGGSYTVVTELGLLVRIEGKDADALGETPTVAPEAPPAEIPTDAAAVEKAVWDQLRTCYDPEIPVNIVELGLVYQNQAAALPEGGFRADIKFTLTAPGCGMGGVLQKEVENKVRGLPGVKDAKVEVVFEPMWTRDMMSEGAKLKLGMF